MQMFQPISGQSSEQSIAYTAYGLARKCLRHYFKLIWESRTTEDTNFHRHEHSFYSNLESNGHQCWLQPQVFQTYFSNPAVFKAMSSFFRSQGCSDEENSLDFSFIFNTINFEDFKVQFYFLCNSAFIPQQGTFNSSLTVAWFLWTNHNSLLCTATNQFALFCKNNKWRQIAIFLFVKRGNAPLLSYMKWFWI